MEERLQGAVAALQWGREFIAGSQPGSLFVLIVVLYYVGHFMTAALPTCRRLGWKIAGCVGVLVSLGEVFLSGPTAAGDALSAVWAGLAAGGLSLGVSWSVLPLLLGGWDYFVATPGRWFRATWGAMLDDARRSTEKRTAELTRKQAQIAWERNAPERERARVEAEARAQAAKAEQKRREDVRAACELLYGFFAPEIGSRFPKAAFDDFEKKYLGDDRPAAEVEARGEELKAILKKHHDLVRPALPATSLLDLARWYERELAAIESLPLAESFKDAHRMQLNFRYAELTEKFLEQARP